MKNYLFALLAVTFGLISCSRDNKELPKLNKLTNVSCTKNGQNYFSADISYENATGNISRIVLDLQRENETVKYNDNYIYTGNTISVVGMKSNNSSGNSFIHTVYTIDGDVISQEEDKMENPYKDYEVYTSAWITNSYLRYQIQNISSTIQSYNIKTSQYEKTELGVLCQYSWENDNVSRFRFNLKEVAYEYSTQMRPETFPFRVLETISSESLSLQPEEAYRIVSPINFLYSSMNKNLVQRAYWYKLTEPGTVCGEYTFSYTVVGEYVTGMTIREKINAGNGIAAQDNTYEYSFTYNFLLQ
ncbi:MAG: hypothetical protein PARBA_04176 [Parabacteroides sp.]|jgi:hypothetical protein